MHLYIVYKILNKINNKFYVGVHKTTDINDDYYGSGNSIKAAIEKYGKENFSKEILHVFTNARKAFEKEKEIVTKELINSEMCYNIKEGGHGGFDHVMKTGLHRSSQGRKIIHKDEKQTKVKLEHLNEYLENGWKLGFRPSSIEKMSESGKIKIQSEEHKRKNSETKKGCVRMLNPYTSKMKFVKKDQVNKLLENGWSMYRLQRKKLIS